MCLKTQPASFRFCCTLCSFNRQSETATVVTAACSRGHKHSLTLSNLLWHYIRTGRWWHKKFALLSAHRNMKAHIIKQSSNLISANPTCTLQSDIWLPFSFPYKRFRILFHVYNTKFSWKVDGIVKFKLCSHFDYYFMFSCTALMLHRSYKMIKLDDNLQIPSVM